MLVWILILDIRISVSVVRKPFHRSEGRDTRDCDVSCLVPDAGEVLQLPAGTRSRAKLGIQDASVLHDVKKLMLLASTGFWALAGI